MSERCQAADSRVSSSQAEQIGGLKGASTGWEDGTGGESHVSDYFRMMLRTVERGGGFFWFFFQSSGAGAHQRGSLIPGLTGRHVVWSPAEVNRFLSGATHDVTRQMFLYLMGSWILGINWGGKKKKLTEAARCYQ